MVQRQGCVGYAQLSARAVEGGPAVPAARYKCCLRSPPLLPRILVCVNEMLLLFTVVAEAENISSAPGCAFALVQKAYKKSLLKIHPDKADPNNFEAHTRSCPAILNSHASDRLPHTHIHRHPHRATEMFKVVNAAFTTLKDSQK